MKKIIFIILPLFVCHADDVVQDGPKELPYRLPSVEQNTDSDSFFDDLWKKITTGGVYKLDKPKVGLIPHLPPEHKYQSPVERISQYYSQSHIPSEGLSTLRYGGSNLKSQAQYYRAHPDQFALDVYRRIQYVRSNRGGLSDLEDVFRLQNYFRNESAPDPVQEIGFQKSADAHWLNLLIEPKTVETSFPIHVITLIQDQEAVMSLASPLTLLPTAVRWVRQNSEIAFLGSSDRQPARAVSGHELCARVVSGKHAGLYTSAKFFGPHVQGHGDIEWWVQLVQPQEVLPRRIALMMNINPQMCEQTRAFESLMRARWEGMSYATVPVYGSMVGAARGEQGVPFRQWKKDRTMMQEELKTSICLSKDQQKLFIGKDMPWNRKEVVSSILRDVFGQDYRFGDTTIVVLSEGDAHLPSWVELSRVSGGVHVIASPKGLVSALDVAVRTSSPRLSRVIAQEPTIPLPSPKQTGPKTGQKKPTSISNSSLR